MSPHRRNSQTLDGATAILPEVGLFFSLQWFVYIFCLFTLFLFTYKDAASAGLRYDLQNGPWPCSCPQGCVYNNGSNAEHILITKEDILAGLGKIITTFHFNIFLVLIFLSWY